MKKENYVDKLAAQNFVDFMYGIWDGCYKQQQQLQKQRRNQNKTFLLFLSSQRNALRNFANLISTKLILCIILFRFLAFLIITATERRQNI